MYVVDVAISNARDNKLNVDASENTGERWRDFDAPVSSHLGNDKERWREKKEEEEKEEEKEEEEEDVIWGTLRSPGMIISLIDETGI